MRYYGFATIDYLILQNLHFCRDSSVLEIGVGTGSTARLIIGNVKKFSDIDISEKTVEQLNLVYKTDRTAFRIIKTGGLKLKLYTAYASIITRLASCFPLYKLYDILYDVRPKFNDKVLLMHLGQKK